MLIALGLRFELIGIRYPQIVGDEPLRSPVRVISVEGEKLVLEDGREIELEGDPIQGTWLSTMMDTHFMIDVDSYNSGPEVEIRGNKKGWVCGTPWAHPIQIPIIADKVYRNRRQFIGYSVLRTPAKTHSYTLTKPFLRDHPSPTSAPPRFDVNMP